MTSRVSSSSIGLFFVFRLAVVICEFGCGAGAWLSTTPCSQLKNVLSQLQIVVKR